MVKDSTDGIQRTAETVWGKFAEGDSHTARDVARLVTLRQEWQTQPVTSERESLLTAKLLDLMDKKHHLAWPRFTAAGLTRAQLLTSIFDMQ